jgi:hypothetical protein
MRPSPADELCQAGGQVPVQTAHLVGREGPRWPARCQARPPEHLVGNQIPDSSQPGLVEQAGLHGDPAVVQGGPDICQGGGQGVRPEARLVGIELDRPQTSGVPHRQPAAIHEVHGEPVVTGLIAWWRVEQAVDAGPAVDDQPSGHPEMQSQHDIDLIASGTGIEEHELAPTAGADELAVHQRGLRFGGDQAPLEIPGVGSVDPGDTPPQGRPLGQGPVALDLRELGHQSEPRASSRARMNTASNMAAVSLPVKVFCWLGW